MHIQMHRALEGTGPCMQGDMEGHRPCVTEFMEACAALMHARSELLLAQVPSLPVRTLHRCSAMPLHSNALNCKQQACNMSHCMRLMQCPRCC